MSSDNNPMLSLFYMEADMQFPCIQTNLNNLVDDKEVEADELSKALTSFKGAAKIAGLDLVFQATVALEVLLDSYKKQKSNFNNECISAIKNTLDIFEHIISKKDVELTSFAGKENDLANIIPLLTTSDSTEEKKVAKEEPAKKERSAPIADLSMLDLFRIESESQTRILTDTLIELEDNPEDPTYLENLMRAAHSLKGAARMVGLDHAVSIGHVMEDVFVAAQNNKLVISADDMDILLSSVDLLANLAKSTNADYNNWCDEHSEEIDNANIAIKAILDGDSKKAKESSEKIKIVKETPTNSIPGQEEINPRSKADESNVRVSTKNLNKLLGISSEAQIESRWLQPFSESLLQVKKQQTELIKMMDSLRGQLVDLKANDTVIESMNTAHQKADMCRDLLSQRLTDLENYDRRSNNLSHRLNSEIIKIRMRPFSDGTKGFSRLVRDVSRSLDKDIKLKIKGLNTQVDRDILDKLQAPLNHLLRNAIDHGIEDKNERAKSNKDKTGIITLEAIHAAGMLSIKITDDGRGIDLDKLRKKIIKKKLVSADMADKLSESELLDFLFLPNFSTRDDVTEISGRGVGLDVVHTALQGMRGTIRATTKLGQGMTFLFQLPLTLSVIRALLVTINNEVYAFPLAHINKTLKISPKQIETMEGRQYFTLGSNHVGLITAHQILNVNKNQDKEDEIPVIILGDRLNSYAVVVDDFLGERNLSVHTIDERLGKIQNISSASLTEDGDPLLIFDVEDMLRSIDILLSDGRLQTISSNDDESDNDTEAKLKRVLVVDDSITVRETERSLLQKEGYYVEVAVDGMDGWNATRTEQYDLIISDIDMPRMNGFELVENIKSDERFKDIPVIIVSYKDREEDRMRGLDVGADYYLTKGSFHDDTFIDAVIDLIGEA